MTRQHANMLIYFTRGLIQHMYEENNGPLHTFKGAGAKTTDCHCSEFETPIATKTILQTSKVISDFT